MNDDRTESIESKARLWAIAGTAKPVAASAAGGEAEPDLFQISRGDGYEKWKQEQAAERLAFEKQWGVPLGKQVRVQLRGEPRERVGRLQAAAEPKGRSKTTASRHLRLRIGEHIFLSSQIESLVRV
ncbi:MAG: hypothetical protein Q8M07_20465 [Prosthecobacter sp.]|nr:hypothetical protein [Prosthecobacter sp.]